MGSAILVNEKDSTRVSIGLPAFNGETHIARAITSLLQQTMTNFELVISDNASTDKTAEMIRMAAGGDTRVKYIRQVENIGAMANFKFVLDQATCSYFMWAAADDHWHAEFLAENATFLEANEDYAASISQVEFDDCETDYSDVMGTFALEGSIEENQYRFILRPDCNSRYYGLHRTNAVRAAWSDERFWASDWAFICRELVYGKFHEVPRVLMWRSSRGQSSDSYLAIRRWRLGRLDTIFPMLRFSLFVLGLPTMRGRLKVWARLILINAALTFRMNRGMIRDLFNARRRNSW